MNKQAVSFTNSTGGEKHLLRQKEAVEWLIGFCDWRSLEETEMWVCGVGHLHEPTRHTHWSASYS